MKLVPSKTGLERFLADKTHRLAELQRETCKGFPMMDAIACKKALAESAELTKGIRAIRRKLEKMVSK